MNYHPWAINTVEFLFVRFGGWFDECLQLDFKESTIDTRICLKVVCDQILNPPWQSTSLVTFLFIHASLPQPMMDCIERYLVEGESMVSCFKSGIWESIF
jgi:hypothetical protein